MVIVLCCADFTGRQDARELKSQVRFINHRIKAPILFGRQEVDGLA